VRHTGFVGWSLYCFFLLFWFSFFLHLGKRSVPLNIRGCVHGAFAVVVLCQCTATIPVSIRDLLQVIRDLL
jgi:hypothetical protein